MAGGGGGGDSYKGISYQSVQQKIEQAREKERKSLEANVNALLDELLASYNSRDTNAIMSKLDELKSLLGDKTEIDKTLFGGSIAKHTDIDGISDVDALVILDRSDLQGKSPQEMLDVFYKTLSDCLPRNNIESINKGDLAVTVKYKDNTEIQLLPALRSRNTISIAAADGKQWNDTKPKTFQQELTTANTKTNQALVPAIKLFKSINSDFPKQKQLTGYHIEAMAVDAVKDYKGNNTPSSLLIHLFGHSSERVLNPIKDKTGQTRTVDAYLGKANSMERRNISQTLLGMKRRLESATSVSQWRVVFGK